MNRIMAKLLNAGENTLFRDPFVLDLITNRMSDRSFYKKNFSPTTEKNGVLMSMTEPLRVGLLKYVIVKFKLDASESDSMFDGRTGYAYALVGKYGAVQWLPLPMVYKDSDDLYNLFADKPTLLSSMMMTELNNIRSGLIL